MSHAARGESLFLISSPTGINTLRVCASMQLRLCLYIFVVDSGSTGRDWLLENCWFPSSSGGDTTSVSVSDTGPGNHPTVGNDAGQITASCLARLAKITLFSGLILGGIEPHPDV